MALITSGCVPFGPGAVIHSATDIAGPWVRQSRDVNCNADAAVCDGGSKDGDPSGAQRPDHSMTVHAQGLGLSVIGDQFIWQGELLAVGETFILLHPPLPLLGVSIGMERGCQQNDSVAGG